jgi:pentatricopeptide repeat protein
MHIFVCLSVLRPAVINAWASSESEETIERVEALVREMEERTDDPFVPRTNRITYNTCIKAMRNGSQEEAVRAEQLLLRLEERAADNDNDDFYPDSYSYTAVISAYGRSGAPDKALSAWQVLQRMISSYENGNRHAYPSIHAFNAALNACAFLCDSSSKERKRDTFSMALDILQLLKEYTKPDHTTYGTMLRACSSLLPAQGSWQGDDRNQRDTAVATLFDRACQEGQVGRLVMTQLRFAASHELYKSLMQGREISDKVFVQDLPREWSCNVREQYRRAKKQSHHNHSRSGVVDRSRQ